MAKEKIVGASGTGGSKVNQMEELLKRNDSIVTDIENSDILEKINKTQEEIEEASNIEDKVERNTRLEILNSTMKDLREAADAEEVDLAEAVLGLNILIEKMGGEYGNLTELNVEEKKIISDAEDMVEIKNTAVSEAESSWMPFGKDARIQEAKTAFENAKLNVESAKSEAKKQMRARLMNASMEDSLQTFQVKVERTISIMKDRLNDIKIQVEAVGIRKDAAFAAKEESAKDLEKYSQKVEDLESDLFDAEEELESYSNGSSEYTSQESKISNIKSDLEDARGSRDTALGIFQSKEKFAKELEVHEVAQKKLRNNQQTWIKTLNSDTEERIVTFKSRLEAMKASSDQEIAKELDKMGAAVDQNNVEFMAKVTVSSDKIMEDKVAAHPKRFEKMVKVQEALAEHVFKSDQKMKDMVSEMKDKYGVDPIKSQFVD